MAEGERGGWLPPRDDDDRAGGEQQGGMSSGDPLWSGRQDEPQPPPRGEEQYHGWQPPTSTGGQPGGWQPPPAGQGAPPQWGAAPGQPGYAPAPDSNGKATAALVCGIVGILFCPIIFSVAAIILGYQSRNEIDASQGRQGNRGIATAGIITGWVGIAFGVLLIVFFVLVGIGMEGDGDGGVFSEPAISLLRALPL